MTNFTELVKLQLELRKMVVDDPTLAIPGPWCAGRDPAGGYSQRLL